MVFSNDRKFSVYDPFQSKSYTLSQDRIPWQDRILNMIVHLTTQSQTMIFQPPMSNFRLFSWAEFENRLNWGLCDSFECVCKILTSKTRLCIQILSKFVNFQGQV